MKESRLAWSRPELKKVSLKAATFGNGSAGPDACGLRASGSQNGCS